MFKIQKMALVKMLVAILLVALLMFPLLQMNALPLHFYLLMILSVAGIFTTIRLRYILNK